MTNVSGSKIDHMRLDHDFKELVQTLKSKDEYARKEAARALGQIGTENCIKYLLNALEDDNWGVRAVAAQALGNLADYRQSEVKEKITKAIQDKNWSVRCTALEALAHIEGINSIDEVSKALLDKDPHVQKMAFKILEEFKKKDDKEESLIY
ncbi:HEAT repeat domain-containing protein [Methanobacterium alcaliphilum]|uniref:HEAT repeat domain-containing protein n=1 Tax=Methanobacterium alcaliphilum TaxID=392018 RepID=UPI00200B4899|nr:HEAT repeat domain-containing protein [Methanobacterium alcaliphilum]